MSTPATMSSTDSVTRWIEQLKAGDQRAAQPLWERYYRRLVRLARGQLRGARRRAEEGLTPAFASELAEEFRRRLDSLGDDTLRAVALWKLEGYANEEIAEKLNCVVRTVERKLRVIRAIWGKAGRPA